MAKPKNPAAFTPVLEWLDRGAPHEGVLRAFNMNDYVALDFADEVALHAAIGVAKEDEVRQLATHCGAACCIAGALVVTHDGVSALLDVVNGTRNDDHEHARKLAGMRRADADELFTPRAAQHEEAMPSYSKIPPAWAARTIRDYLQTGVVDWIKNKDE